MIRVRRLAPLVVGCALALLAGCGGGGAARTDSQPAVPSRLAAGTLSVALPTTGAPPVADLLLTPSVVFTDRFVVMVTGTNVLRVVDRATMRQLWSKPLPRENNRNGACQLRPLARDATAVTVFVGLQCAQVRTFRLSDGAQLFSTDAGIVGVAGYAVMGRTTYFADQEFVFAVDEQGARSTIASLESMGFDHRDQILGLIGRTDSLLVARVIHYVHGKVATRRQDFYVGLDISDHNARVTWRVGINELQPPAPVTDQSPKSSLFPGYMFMVSKAGRLIAARHNVSDGKLTTAFLHVPRLRNGQVPIIVSGYSTMATQVLTVDDMVITPVGDGGLSNYPEVALYDLAAHRVRWTSRIARIDSARGRDLPETAAVAGITADRELIYVVRTSNIGTADLVAVNAATGAETQRWPLPDEVTSAFARGQEVAVDGDLVVSVSKYPSEPGWDGAVMTVAKGG